MVPRQSMLAPCAALLGGGFAFGCSRLSDLSNSRPDAGAVSGDADAEGPIDDAAAMDASPDAATPCDPAHVADDPHHCGQCGHDCLGGACAHAVCQPF